MRTRLLPLALLGVLLVVTGCSDEPRVVKVSGVVTHNGEPVPNLRLNFQPEKGRPSWGDTNEKGEFTLEYDATRKGAQVGMHTVSASYLPRTGDEEMSGKMPPVVKSITDKYGDMQNSPLKIEITGSIDNLEVKFD
ncbi:MAG: hypothetical protein L0241_32090 [Planctomycetia bacterium]|nr:hypothetical protein [Planctomycetia bacterium]